MAGKPTHISDAGRRIAVELDSARARPASQLSASIDALLDAADDEMVLRRYSPRTRKVYVGHIRRFLQSLDRPVDSLTGADVRNHILRLTRRERVTVAYHRQAISALSFFFTRVLKDPKPMHGIPLPERDRKLPLVLDRDDVRRILAATTNAKHRLVLALVYSAGLRIGEVVRLRVGDVDRGRRMRARTRRGRLDLTRR
ncbi:MAG TPA: site-specific integrase [Longimicrobiales bacterium]|nr:site-specific integrase [Longimicrobiales bacterium]